jgi:hypothetical protein
LISSVWQRLLAAAARRIRMAPSRTIVTYPNWRKIIGAGLLVSILRTNTHVAVKVLVSVVLSGARI